MATHRLFLATITRKVFVLLSVGGDEDIEDAAWSLADELVSPDPSDPGMEEVTDCERVVRVWDSDHLRLVPRAKPHNTRTIQQLIDAGALEMKR